MIPPESPAAPSPQGDAASGRAEPVPRRHAHGLLRGLLNFQAPTGDARLLFGFWLGVLGVTCFAITLPATRLATGTAADPQLSPAFVTAGRAALAGLLSAAFLLIARSPWPTGAQWRALSLSMAGNVIGFPLLLAWALRSVTATHAAVILALLPLATAAVAAWALHQRARPAFWACAVLGSALVVGFALSQGLSASPTGDLLMLAAILACGLGYAEGAKLSRSLGGWQVICWALVMSLPLMAVLSLWLAPASFGNISLPAWMCLGYVSLFSMLIGFVFWYRGLAQGGIAAVGQLQLLQPFFGLALAATLLHEQVSVGMLGVTLGVILCVAGAKKFAK